MMYKEAIRKRLRFQTESGNLTTERLWDLDTTELDALAVRLEEEYKNSGKKSFLVKKSKKDKILKLKLNIVVDILETKVDEEDLDARILDIERENQKIFDELANRKDNEIKEISTDELKKRIKKVPKRS